MRIRTVTAHAFGPLTGETLELAEGLTVVVGDNESAKSSWHAAIYAAVCGRRRSRGQPRQEERRFAELHKPWNGDEWLVSAQIKLDDGRLIEVRHDLARMVDSSAKDLTLGADVSAEIMNEGAPDAARWLGLDRNSFAATACVQQAEMLRVMREANGLQQCLQQAAATAGTDATAAAAIEKIDMFLRDRVGLDRANSTRPLRRALDGLSLTREDLEQRRKAHEEYLDRLAEVDELRDVARSTAAELLGTEAVMADLEARRLQERAVRAEELSARYPDGPPETSASDDVLSRGVQRALTTWNQRPAVPPTPKRPATAIQQEIEALPQMPEGDLEVHPSVQDAIDRLNALKSQLEIHDQSRPTEPDVPPQVPAGDQELLDLAAALEGPLPSVPVDLIKAEQVARAAAQAPTAKFGVGRLVIAGVAVLALGILLAALSVPAVGVAVAAGGVLLAAAGFAKRRRGDPLAAAREHVEAEGRLRVAQEQVAQAARRRELTMERCHQLGVDADPRTLRAIPLARAQATAAAGEQQRWSEQRNRLTSQIADAVGTLQQAIAGRGATAHSCRIEDVLAAADRYRIECKTRADQAAAAERRSALEGELATTQEAERRADADREARLQADKLVLDAAADCEIRAAEPAEAVRGLEFWMDKRTGRLQELSESQEEWAELQALLDGSSLADLQRAAAVASDAATRLATSADPELLSKLDPGSVTEGLGQLRQAASEAQTDAASAEGELRQFASGLLDVAEAEEAVQAAEEELDRLRQLEATLRQTRKFLEGAQTRVHQTIAPILASSLKRWLPAVTDGRYTDALVDTTNLQVQVCGPTRSWREADRLSYGTAEQVYLLLRVALVEQLTLGHDICPLLLDDITVHADATRSRHILDLLLTIADERQVVIFTQEQLVAEWAYESLTFPRHAIRHVEPVPVI